MIPRTLLRLASAAAMAGCVVGCSKLSSPVDHWKPVVHDLFATDPQSYPRIGIVPIVLTMRGTIDETLTMQQLLKSRFIVATNIIVGLSEAFTVRGYQLVNTPVTVTVSEEWEQFDSDTRQLLEEVHREFRRMSAVIAKDAEQQRERLSNSLTPRGNPMAAIAMARPIEVLPTRFGPRFKDLVQRLGLQDANAIVLVHESAFVESGKAQSERHARNQVAMVAGGIIYGSPEGLVQHLAMIDTETRDVLWIRVKPTEGGVSPYSRHNVLDAIDKLLKEFPSLSNLRMPTP